MIPIKTSKEIEIMKKGGRILAEIMEEVKKKVVPGIATIELDQFAEKLAFKFGEPSFKGYQGYPATLCCSINEEIVHGLPSERKLKEGDIISLDLGLFYKGFHSDMAATLPVGNVSDDVLKLIVTTENAFKVGLKEAYQGNFFGDISNAIQRHIESQNLSVIKNLCGHGIGKNLHEDPNILNYGEKKDGFQILKGMVFCLEPMASMGSSEIQLSRNKHTYETKDGSFSSHFEHTVAITDNGCEVLTKL
jgi:methionyl aminopeptidase